MTEDASPLLKVTDLYRAHGGVMAVAGASFEVAKGSMTALIGPNGAGKTTVFDVISGFLRPHAGSVVYDGRSIGGNAPEQIAVWRLLRTFQLTRIFNVMTVIDNMLIGAQRSPGERLSALIARPIVAYRHDRDARDRARELLLRFGLGGKEQELGGSLSGGQRKLLELARVMMAGPQLVLLDEPFAGVNPTLKLELLLRIREIRESGVTVLFVEHDIEIVMREAERVIVMAAGSVIMVGSPDAVREDPRVLDAYFGTATKSA